METKRFLSWMLNIESEEGSSCASNKTGKQSARSDCDQVYMDIHHLRYSDKGVLLLLIVPD